MAAKKKAKRKTGLEVQMVPLSRLKMARNARHNDGMVAEIVRSIENFGYTNPILVQKGTNEILAGHTRFKALMAMGETEGAVIFLSMTAAQARAYRIFDNKSTEKTPWDMGILAEEFKALEADGMDLALTGFEEDEIERILDTVEEETEKAGGEGEEVEIEFATELMEEQNYVVLTFDNSVDWLTVQQWFGLKTVKALDAKKGYERKGIGRVVDGKEFLRRIGEKE